MYLENKDGSVYLYFETNQLSQTASWVMSFTGSAKVLNPPELKDMVKKAAEEILKQNQNFKSVTKKTLRIYVGVCKNRQYENK